MGKGKLGDDKKNKAKGNDSQNGTQLASRTPEDLEALLLALNETALVSETNWVGEITYANDKFVEISKYSREELIGQNHRILKSGHHSRQFYRDLWQTIVSGKVWRGRIKNRAKDGTYYWVDTSIAPIMGKDGEPIKYISVRFPISEQMELQEELENLNTELEEKVQRRTKELRKGEKYLRDLTNSMPQLVWTANPDGTIDYSNDKYREYEGTEKEEKNYIWSPSVHPEDEDMTLNTWKDAVTNGSIYQVEHRVKLKNGKYRWHLSRGIPMKDKKGKVVKWYGTATDIHELKQAEDRLKYHSYLVDNVSDAIISTSPDYTILSWNKGAERLYGYRAEEVIGRAVNDVIETEYLQPLTQEETAQEIRANNYWQGELRQQCKDGSWIYTLASGSMIKDSNGKLIGYVSVNTDITERKRLEEKKDEFLGIASHELKTPLTSIKGYIQILERISKEKGNEDAEHYLSRTNVYINKLNSLIMDLLNVSRIQAGKLQMNLEQFDMHDLIQEVIDSIQPTSVSHKISFQGQGEAEIVGDRQRLEQVLQNLLGNAIKYSPNEDRIIVTSERSGGELCVAVQDFGIGIPEKKINKIFERFYRVEETEKDYSGMGIGLYTAQEIVNRHSGKMWVESTLGKGSKFTFILPVKIPE